MLEAHTSIILGIMDYSACAYDKTQLSDILKYAKD